MRVFLWFLSTGRPRKLNIVTHLEAHFQSHQVLAHATFLLRLLDDSKQHVRVDCAFMGLIQNHYRIPAQENNPFYNQKKCAPQVFVQTHETASNTQSPRDVSLIISGVSGDFVLHHQWQQPGSTSFGSRCASAQRPRNTIPPEQPKLDEGGGGLHNHHHHHNDR